MTCLESPDPSLCLYLRDSAPRAWGAANLYSAWSETAEEPIAQNPTFAVIAVSYYSTYTILLCLCSRWDTFKNLGCYDMHTLLITHSIVVSNLRLLIKRVLSEPGKVGRPRTGSEFWWVMCWVYHEWLLQKLYPLLLLSMRMFFIISLCVCVCVYLSVCAFLSLVYCLSTPSSV